MYIRTIELAVNGYASPTRVSIIDRTCVIQNTETPGYEAVLSQLFNDDETVRSTLLLLFLSHDILTNKCIIPIQNTKFVTPSGKIIVHI